MRIWFLFFIYGVLILGLKSVWPIPGDFLCLAVIWFGFYKEGLRGLGVALMLGFLFDCLSIGPLGTSLIAYALIFCLIRLLRRQIFFRSILAQTFWIAFFSLLAELISFGCIRLFGRFYHPFSSFLFYLVGNVLVNALFGPLWLRFLSWYSDLTWEQLKIKWNSNKIFFKNSNRG